MELSRRKDKSDKANEDYTKRTQDPRNVNPSSATFVFVTPRVWGNREDWIAERLSEGRWRDVRVLDAGILAQWIDSAPGVGAWLAPQLGKLPETGIISLDEFWEDWAQGHERALSPELVLAGRSKQKQLVEDWARGPAAQFFVQGETKDEAIAFLHASAAAGDEDWGRSLLSRCLVVRTAEAWRALVRQPMPLVLVPSFSDAFSPSSAVQSGHHVLIPIESGEQTAGTGCTLPRLGREELVGALVNMGLENEEARGLAQRTARSMPVLRRRLIARAGGPRPDWAASSTARSLIPALLVGQWDDQKAGDRSIVEAIANRPYNNVMTHYIGLSSQPDAPVRKIGNRWRLISHDEAWELLSPHLTVDDLDRFQTVVIRTLIEEHPKLDVLPDSDCSTKDLVENYLSKRYACSDIIRNAMSQTLALMGSRPEHVVAVPNTRERAEYVVSRILEHGNDWRLWATLGTLLTTLAEAAPEIVLDRVQDVLESMPGTFVELFNREGHGCPHAGLLWALERLAWSPDHFSRVAFALAHLADLDPGGKYKNRPTESLRSLFLPWIRHSTVSDEHRLIALDEVLRRFPDAGWKLITGICSKGYHSISGRELPGWRGWGHDLQQPTFMERFDFANAVIDRALRDVDLDAERWCDLMDVLPYFAPQRRGEALQILEDSRGPLKSSRASAALWARIRSLLNRHRVLPNADGALASEELDKLASVYTYLRPDDPVLANAWLFGHWPDLPEGEARGRKHLVRVEQARSSALANLLQNHGGEIVIELARCSAAPWAVGQTFASVCPDEQKIASLVMPCLGHADPSLREFAVGALRQLRGNLGWPVLERILEQARTAGLAPQQLVDIYLAAPVARETWERLEREPDELHRWYWLSVGDAFTPEDDNLDDLKYAFQNLLDVGRPFPVIRRLAQSNGPVDSTLMIQALELAPAALRQATHGDANINVDSYAIAKVFGRLDEATDVARQTIARLEIPFVSILDHHRPHLALHHEVLQDPTTFSDLVSWAFKSSDIHVEEEVQSEQERTARAHLAWDILYHIRRVPGQNEDGSIDAEHLTYWVAEARRLCVERGRADIGDQMIGQILANAPEGSDNIWPCQAVRDVLENTGRRHHLGLGFRVGKYNLRGVTWRGLTQGGLQERALAAEFRDYAGAVHARYPFVARLLRSLAENYEREGRNEDLEADWRDLGE